MRTSRLTVEQWRQARRRWEGSPNQGFQWLANEVADAWGVELTRVAFQNVARRDGWARGGAPSTPLPRTAPARPQAAPVAKATVKAGTNPHEAAAQALQALAAALSGDLAGATVVVLVMPGTAKLR